MPTKQVKFTKYICPFDELLQSWESDEETGRLGLVDLEGDGYEEQPKFKKGPNIGPAIVSDSGILPINDKTLLSKNFNLWMMATNFSISANVAECVENCPGVECLNVYTKYRARVGFGELFNARDVQETLRILLCEPPKPKKINPSVYETTQKFLSAKYPYWAMVTVNSTIVPITGTSQDAVENKLLEYSGKEIIKSWQ